MRALVIEDDVTIGSGLRKGLAHTGISADWVKNGAHGLEALATTQYSVVLLDLGLPGLSGLDVLTEMRRGKDKTPVIVVTARDNIESRISGLDLGADDYLIKPFDMDELAARIRAVLRRHSGHASTKLDCGEISLDLANHTISYRSLHVVLPAREFALVQALAERPGAILSKSQLEERLYGWGEEVESNAIDVLIYSIRKKFDKSIIRNVRGVGWAIPGKFS
jgi:two-component system, OmpR family, response regulator